MSTENIKQFLMSAFSDEGLAALLAHAEDGHLSFTSCTCLVGSVNPGHALLKTGEYCGRYWHLFEARKLPFAEAAEEEFNLLGYSEEHGRRFDSVRRERIIPLIRAELLRREKERKQSSASCFDSAEAIEVV